MPSLRIVVTAGDRYGRLTIVSEAPRAGDKRTFVVACDCGTTKVVSLHNLRKPQYPTRSCGCLGREQVSRLHGALTTHGHAAAAGHSPEYRSWSAMVQRCENPSNDHYQYYGGRGIKVCAEWREDFAAFLAHIGPKPSPELTIDRVDNNGDYEPGNVRWATRAEQNRNKRTPSQMRVAS